MDVNRDGSGPSNGEKGSMNVIENEYFRELSDNQQRDKTDKGDILEQSGRALEKLPVF